jgi:predicted 3-demethylubiquinone-9 3-methyltransferase (glyoxalase superfamily)
MQKITPCLWFDSQAEEAAKFYVSLFENSRIGNITRYGEAGSQASGQRKGSVMTVSFQLDGQDFTALNGGPHFKFNEAISLMINCETQEEVDDLWERLSKGGEILECGWVKDKYGLAWQVVPKMFFELISDKDPAKAERAMQAMLKMKKLDIRELKRAAEGQG